MSVVTDAKVETYEDFLSVGLQIIEDFREDHWRLGDWSVDVETKFNKKTFNAMASDLGESMARIRQCKWVSQKFPDGPIRQTHLSWSHYRAAAGTDDPEHWIDEAVKNNWTVNALKEQLKIKDDNYNAQAGTVVCSICEKVLVAMQNLWFLRQNGKEKAFCTGCLKEFVAKIEEVQESKEEGVE